MYTSKWVVFNKQGEKIKTVTLKHKDGAVYRELEPFEAKLLEQGLSAQRAESFEQFKGKRMAFKKQLECLGWQFDKNGNII
jgi:hypothetical protein